MNIIISHFIIAEDGCQLDHRDIKSFTEKLRQKFKVCAKPAARHDHFNEFVVSFIGYSQEAMSQKMDDIADFCERSGLGRVETEQTFLDDIENLFGDQHDEFTGE